MNKKDLINLQNTVEVVLRENMETRIDDRKLIYSVLKVINPEVVNMNVGTVLENGRDFKLPSFESITRARRMVFTKYPELCPKDIKKLRKQLEKQYKEWSKE